MQPQSKHFVFTETKKKYSKIYMITQKSWDRWNNTEQKWKFCRDHYLDIKLFYRTIVITGRKYGTGRKTDI